MQLTIKTATIKDAPSITLLGRMTFDETFGHLFRDKQDLLDYFGRTFTVEKITKSLAQADNIFWLAYIGNIPVGYAKLKLDSESKFVENKKTCQLQKIYVLKDFLSKKIGHNLQYLLLLKAKELAYETIWLSVLDSNERAIRFYEKHDFKIIGDHDFQIGKENFSFKVMCKELVTENEFFL